MKFDEAVEWCASNKGGLPGDGWRLPNIAELVSMFNLGAAGKNDGAFGGGKGYVWAAPTGNSPYCCPVSFVTGSSGCDNSNDYFFANVRCVRGSPLAAGWFQEGGDGTVSDLATGLVWQKTADPESRTW